MTGMIRARFAIPGDPDTPTGGYVFDKRLAETALQAGLELEPLPLPGGFPDPDAAQLDAALSALRRAAALERSPILIDGLALGALPAEALAALPAPLVAMHHHPLGLEPGLPPERAAALIASERAAMQVCANAVVTSEATARTVIELFGLAPDRIRVALPGLDLAAPAPRRGAPPVILGVGTISHRKGWDVLAEALGTIAHLDWRAEIIGPRDRDPQADAALVSQLEGLGLTGRVTLRGALPARALQTAYAGADLFCLPSRYEGYGMAPVEAMAHALPAVLTDAGALAEAADGAALMVPPEDPAALAAALSRVLTDRAEADRLAALSHARAARAPGWRDAALVVKSAILQCMEGAA